METIRIQATDKRNQKKGVLAVDPLYRGDGTGEKDVIVHFYPDGTNFHDLGNQESGAHLVGKYKKPATVKTVAQSIEMSLEYNNKLGD